MQLTQNAVTHSKFKRKTCQMTTFMPPFLCSAYLPTQDKSLPHLTLVEISVLTMRVTFDLALHGFSKVLGCILSQMMDQKGPDPMSQ